MSLFRKAHRKHVVPAPHRKKSRGADSRFRICRFEQMESRDLLSVVVPSLNVGATYYQPYDGTDSIGSLLYISWNGGAAGTHLTDLYIDTHKVAGATPDFSVTSPVPGDVFFHTAPSSIGGTMDGVPPSVLEWSGSVQPTITVINDSTLMDIHFADTDFSASGRLVLKVNVDIMESWASGDAKRVVEGADFDGTSFEAVFSADHYQTSTFTGFFRNVYNNPQTTYGLNLPDDNYDNTSAIFTTGLPPADPPDPVFTAGVLGSITQTPLPITLSGTVYEDYNVNNVRDSGEPGIPGVTLTLLQLDNGAYVSTGLTATTDANGNYSFNNLLPDTYQIVETQPDGYLSVGDTPGTVNGATRGVVTTVDILSGINLDGGDNSINNDFAEVKPASVSGYVYVDANDNGHYDAGETPIAGVTLTLLDANGNSTGKTATTDSNGYYHFDNLMPGTYGVSETQPAGYLDGLDSAGTAGGTAHNPGDLIDGITLIHDEAGLNYDFGELLPANLSGYVYVDANDNGHFDSGEAPIPGVLLTLLDSNGNPTGKTATTDANGYYHFDNLMPGTYGVSETQPAGYLDGLDSAGSTGGTAHNPGDLINGIPLASGVSSTDNDFGELLPASISGQVFVDNNQNNTYDPGEPLLSGVTIWLLDGSGNRITSTTTNSSGKYSFTNLTPGTYGVEEIQPSGYLEGGDQVGSAGGQLSGPDEILNAQLGCGINGVSYDFWEVTPATISGYVFQDGPTIVLQQNDPAPNIPSIRNGILTSTDARLSGVTLQLCDGSGYPLKDANGNYITTKTDANGYYQFTMLQPGEYSVVETQPSGYQTGIDTAGSKGGLVVNKYSTVDAMTLSTLAVNPSGNAIVRITVDPGDSAVQNNFSEVLITRQTTPPPPILPPVYPTPITPPPLGLPFVQSPPMGSSYTYAPTVNNEVGFGGATVPDDYDWHLSIIDAGQPRSENSGSEYVDAPQSTVFDPVSWSGPDLTQSQWILADGDGTPIKTIRYGMAHATPVTGDWDGSGTTKVGVFLDGLWFLDLNGNGVWDAGDLWVKLGTKGDQPVTGDWNGDGKTDIGIFGPMWSGDYRPISVEPGLPDSSNPPSVARPKNVPPQPADAAVGYRTLKKGHDGRLRSDLIDHVFEYGEKGDIAVIGDWNGDGIFNIGIFRNGTWFLDMDGDGRWSAGIWSSSSASRATCPWSAIGPATASRNSASIATASSSSTPTTITASTPATR